MPRTARGLVMATIGDHIDERYTITAHCRCRPPYGERSVNLDLEALAARLGRDHSAMAPDLIPHLRCSVCGRRPEMITVAPPGAERK